MVCGESVKEWPTLVTPLITCTLSIHLLCLATISLSSIHDISSLRKKPAINIVYEELEMLRCIVRWLEIVWLITIQIVCLITTQIVWFQPWCREESTSQGRSNIERCPSAFSGRSRSCSHHFSSAINSQVSNL